MRGQRRRGFPVIREVLGFRGGKASKSAAWFARLDSGIFETVRDFELFGG
jgi:hypothetical protein